MEFAFTGVNFFRSPKKSKLAFVNRYTGQLYINLSMWAILPEAHKVFVLCHEEGHWKLQEKDEMRVDQYASARYIQAGYSLSESVTALTQYLDDRKPVHRARAWAQYQRVLKHDFEQNKNPDAWRPGYDTIQQIKKMLCF